MSNDRRNRGRINVTVFTDEHSKEEKKENKKKKNSPCEIKSSVSEV